MKIILLLWFSFFLFNSAAAQTDQSWKVYSDTSLARIDITIDTVKLKWIYSHVDSDSEHYASIHFKNKWIDETVDSIGFRLRGNTSRDAMKKSFKISFNSFFKRKFYGIEKLNLNGEHNDPSIIRSKLCFDLFRDAGITASRASHAQVYINGIYYGLYVSVEHIDEEFIQKNFFDDSGNLWKCLYPADLKYLGSDPNLYRNVMHDAVTSAYELTTNEESGDYSRLAKLIDIISNTPAGAFPDSIEKYLDVRRVLEYFAMNTLVGGWDDYRSLMNNYYLYHILSEDKFTLIPYDYDNTFGIDWFNVNWSAADPYNFPKVNAGARPLSEKLLANNQYRDLFTHILNFYHGNIFLLPLWEQRIDRIKDTISYAASIDTYRTKDYGFTMTDFNNSYSSGSYQKDHVKFGLKQFVNARNASLPSQLNYTNAAPIAYQLNYSPANPGANDTIHVTASCFGNKGLKEVAIQFTPDGSGPQTFAMSFAPVPGTKKVEEADRWTGVIPPLGTGKSGSIKIILKDSTDQTQSYPRHAPIKMKTPSPAATSLLINEFMADNKSIADSTNEFDDWVELFNPTASPVLLTGKYLSDKPDNLKKWRFTQPNLILNPNEHLLIWCDEQPWQGGLHANIKLSAGGEYIALTDSDGVSVIDSITFGQQSQFSSYGRYPSGAGNWTFMPPTPGSLNGVVNSVNDDGAVPTRFSLRAFPNPFNPSTTIHYSIPEQHEVMLRIFDLLGREVLTIAEGIKTSGTHSVKWNGKSSAGNSVVAGMYVIRLSAGNYQATAKIMMVK